MTLSMPVLDIEPTEAGVVAFLTQKRATSLVTVRIRVTPVIARLFLQYNKLNRAISGVEVRRLAEEMRQGRWRETGQGVHFGEEFRYDAKGAAVSVGGLMLYDGQHRLEAVIQSDVTITIHCTLGLRVTDYGALDGNRRRSQMDWLHNRRPLGKYEVSWSYIARMLLGSDGYRRAQLGEAIHQQYYDETQAAIEWGKTNIPRLAAPFRVAPVAGALVFAYTKAPEDVRHFTESLVTKTGLDPGSPVLSLMNYLFQSGRDPDLVTAQKVLRCLYAEVRGEPITKVTVSQEAVAYFEDAYPSTYVLRTIVQRSREPFTPTVTPVPPPVPTPVVAERKTTERVIQATTFALWSTATEIAAILGCGITARHIGALLTDLEMRADSRYVIEKYSTKFTISREGAVRVAREALREPSQSMRAWRAKTGQPFYTVLV